MRAVLLNTGTELLLGDVQDRHLSFIAREIFSIGLRINEQRTVPDGNAIRDALNELFLRADILFVTGGLGPTTDDHTLEIAAEVLHLDLVQDESLLNKIRERLSNRGIKPTKRIERQSFVPIGAQVLPNDNGTAPGLYFAANINPQVRSPHLFLLPGPPRELQPMFRESAMSILRTIVPSSSLHCRIYRITGIGESIVEDAVGEQLLAIPAIELGYCARPGEVDLRIIGDATTIERAHEIVNQKLGKWIFSTGNELLEEIIVNRLTARNETLAVAESCTGGLLANRITNVPGASKIFRAGYVTYSNESKIDILRVDPEMIDKHGAVSDEVARAMADGARRRAGSTYTLSTTGIAGPSGGSTEKPAGTVYIGLATADRTVAKKFFFPNDRETFKQQTAQAAFDLLRRKLL
jgi:nicotinamide-nucleotide amidase